MESRNIPLKLNLDDNVRNTAPDEMKDARNITTFSNDAGDSLLLRSEKGTVKVGVDYVLPAGVNVKVGFTENLSTGSVFYAMWNEAGTHRIIRINALTNFVETVVESVHLNFVQYAFVDMVVVPTENPGEELLFFTDDYNRPGCINVQRAISGFYPAPMNRDYLNAAKPPPTESPAITLLRDNTNMVSNIYGKSLQFAYRYEYIDNEISTYSGISDIAVSEIETSLYTDQINVNEVANNAVDIVLQEGNLEFVRVQVVFRQGQKGAWFIAETIDKSKFSGGIYTLRFFNDGNYSAAVPDEVLSSYDAVPIRAQTVEYTDSKILYGGAVDGYNKTPQDTTFLARYSPLNVTAGITFRTNKFGAAVDKFMYIEMGNVPSVLKGGDKVKVNFTVRVGQDWFTYVVWDSPFTVDFNYVAAAGDTRTIVANALIAYITPFFPGNFTFDWNITVTDAVTIAAGAATANDPEDSLNLIASTGYYLSGNSGIRGFKSGAYHSLAIEYYDNYLYNNTVNRTLDKTYVEVAQLRLLSELNGGATIDYRINHTPPVWAKSYRVLRSQNGSVEDAITFNLLGAFTEISTSRSLYLAMKGLKGEDQSYQEEKGAVLDYSFVEGDRVRVLLEPAAGNTFYMPTEYIDCKVVDFKYLPPNSTENPIYNSSTPATAEQTSGYFLIIERPLGDWSDPIKWYNTALSVAGSIIEIYRPSKDVENALYNEITDKINIINAGTSTRSHAGLLRNQGEAFSVNINDVNEAQGYLVVDNVDPMKFVIGDVVTFTFGGNGTVFTSTITYMYFDLDTQEYRIYVLDSLLVDGDIFPDTPLSLVDLYAAGTLECGDVWIRPRSLPIENSGSKTIGWQLNIAVYVEDFAYSDYLDNIRFDDCRGRINAYSVLAKQVKRDTTVWISEPYVAGSNYNGLSTFNLLTGPFVDYTNAHGSIQRMKQEGDNLYIYFENRVGSALIGKTVLRTGDQQQLVTLNNDILGELNLSAIDYGIGRQPESLAWYSGKHFFSDLKRSGFLRRGQDGVYRISEEKVDVYFENKTKDLSGFANNKTVKVHSGFDLNPKKLYVTHNDVKLGGLLDTISGGETDYRIPFLYDDTMGELRYPVKYDINADNGSVQDLRNIVELGTIILDLEAVLANGGIDVKVLVYFDETQVTNTYDCEYDLATGELTFPDTNLSVVDRGTILGDTISYRAEKSAWISFHDFKHQGGYGRIYDKLLLFKDGHPWLLTEDADRCHYFSETTASGYVPSTFTVISNVSVNIVKHFRSLSIEGTDPWSTNIKTDLNETSLGSDFYEKLESFWYSDILFSESISTANLIPLGVISSIGGNSVSVDGFKLTAGAGVGDEVFLNGTLIGTVTSLSEGIVVISSVVGLSPGDFIYIERNSLYTGDATRGYYAELEFTFVNTPSSGVVEVHAINTKFVESKNVLNHGQ